jgi:SAM-dependent methyltransferase
MSVLGPVPRLMPLPPGVQAGTCPTWDLAKLRHRGCPLCTGDSAEQVCIRPDGLSVVTCRHCGMTYVPDVPADADVERFYASYGKFKRISPSKVSQFEAWSMWWRDPYIAILEKSGGLAGQNLCELGCSYGGFLQIARSRGANVSGVELDEEALQFLRGLGIPASQELDQDRQYDVVCGLQLMEHLDRPSDLIKQVSACLVSDGRLLLAVPNGGEIERVGPAWVGFRVDLEHLNYFSLASLSRLLLQHGLYVEHFWEHHQPIIPRTQSSSARRRQKFAEGWERPFRFLSRLLVRPSWLDGTFVLTVLARKVAS